MIAKTLDRIPNDEDQTKQETQRSKKPMNEILSPKKLKKVNAYWPAANYLSVGQIYLYDNPLLREPLKLSHVEPLVVRNWGTTPGQNFKDTDEN
jgi:phosphoketolase